LVDALIYASVLLGVALLLQLYVLIPMWLFYSVLTGWLAYVVDAVAVATHHKIAYPIALILAALTLFVSLPQPEHYSFVAAGISAASITFLGGSLLQIALLILIPTYLIRERRRRLLLPGSTLSSDS
jgi:hypothetical protein